jgi:protein tyrosine/serine phosphatase
MTRRLAWDGCDNVRDLGGLPTEDGGETRRGAVVRSDNVRNLTVVGWRALVEHGVRTVVDLRFEQERAGDPPGEPPAEVGVVHSPFLAGWTPEEGEELRARVDPLEPASRVRETYFHQLAASRENAAHVVAAIANAPEGAVLVHCMGGKDRTGMLAALLLRLAGVSAETIADDYYESEANLAHLTQRWIDGGEDEAGRARRAWLAPISREGMISVIEKLEERYGSVEEYLLGGGATAEELARVRARLR